MSRSLRLRLVLIILLPLVVLALFVGSWRVLAARQTADAFFDRNLMFTALAVARDVALSDGDAISPETTRLLGETAGGEVRYHVYGPDGALVTGYAVPPIPVTRSLPTDVTYLYTDALYKGTPVRVLRLKDEARIAGLDGTFTITVWQDLAARRGFARELAIRAAIVILSLIIAVGLLIWFGVRFGLKPLTDLEEAISRRSSEDLSPIRRAVPDETKGLVGRLNALFVQVNATLTAQSVFVSDAAHQLRNPIAGLQALGEAIQTAPTLHAAQARATDLVAAASQAGQLANRLLTLERAQAESGSAALIPMDLREVVTRCTADFPRRTAARAVVLDLSLPEDPVPVLGDAVLLREALTNLIDNAFVHGGERMDRVSISLTGKDEARLSVADNGRSVDAAAFPTILSRFGQGGTGPGSGLGLSIAEAVSVRHGGRLSIEPIANGFHVVIHLPLTAANTLPA